LLLEWHIFNQFNER